MSSRPRNPHSLEQIAAYWEGSKRLDKAYLQIVGSGEPSCFRCGWLAPGDDWSIARKYMDKAHLVDHCYGGSMHLSNLAVLCKLCHRAMPSYDIDGYDNAIDYCNGEANRAMPGWTQFTDAIYGIYEKLDLVRDRAKFEVWSQLAIKDGVNPVLIGMLFSRAHAEATNNQKFI